MTSTLTSEDETLDEPAVKKPFLEVDVFEDDIFVGNDVQADNIDRRVFATLPLLRSGVTDQVLEGVSRISQITDTDVGYKYILFVKSTQPLLRQLCHLLQNQDRQLSSYAAAALYNLSASEQGQYLLLHPEVQSAREGPNGLLSKEEAAEQHSVAVQASVRAMLAALVRLLSDACKADPSMPKAREEEDYSPTYSATGCLNHLLQHEDAHAHFWVMPDPTFHALVNSLCLLFDEPPGAEETEEGRRVCETAAVAGEALQAVTEHLSDRVLALPSLPQILAVLTRPLQRLDTWRADWRLLHARQCAEAAVFALAALGSDTARAAKLVTHHSRGLELVCALAAVVRNDFVGDVYCSGARLAASRLLLRTLTHEDTSRWLLAHPDHEVREVLLGLARMGEEEGGAAACAQAAAVLARGAAARMLDVLGPASDTLAAAMRRCLLAVPDHQEGCSPTAAHAIEVIARLSSLLRGAGSGAAAARGSILALEPGVREAAAIVAEHSAEHRAEEEASARRVVAKLCRAALTGDDETLAFAIIALCNLLCAPARENTIFQGLRLDAEVPSAAPPPPPRTPFEEMMRTFTPAVNLLVAWVSGADPGPAEDQESRDLNPWKRGEWVGPHWVEGLEEAVRRALCSGLRCRVRAAHRAAAEAVLRIAQQPAGVHFLLSGVGKSRPDLLLAGILGAPGDEAEGPEAARGLGQAASKPAADAEPSPRGDIPGVVWTGKAIESEGLDGVVCEVLLRLCTDEEARVWLENEPGQHSARLLLVGLVVMLEKPAAAVQLTAVRALHELTEYGIGLRLLRLLDHRTMERAVEWLLLIGGQCKQSYDKNETSGDESLIWLVAGVLEKLRRYGLDWRSPGGSGEDPQGAEAQADRSLQFKLAAAHRAPARASASHADVLANTSDMSQTDVLANIEWYGIQFKHPPVSRPESNPDQGLSHPRAVTGQAEHAPAPMQATQHQADVAEAVLHASILRPETDPYFDVSHPHRHHSQQRHAQYIWKDGPEEGRPGVARYPR